MLLTRSPTVVLLCCCVVLFLRQGPNGVSLANGEGYWHWIDVMADYAAPKKTAQSILVIVLPVVLGGLALIGMLVGVVMWKR